MDWIKELIVIKTKLNDNGFEELSNSITNAQLNLGTPGEMFLNVIQVLNDIKENNQYAFSLIKEEYNNLIKYIKNIGYY